MLLFGETLDSDEDDGEAQPRAMGFVPVTELRFVRPDEMVGRGLSGQHRTSQGQAPPAQSTPPAAESHHQPTGAQQRQPLGPGR